MTTEIDRKEKLAIELGQQLTRRGMMLATAESCTGGQASGLVTSVAGSSGWFDRGFVTYSNAAKQDLLGVQAATLDTYGAVSEETAVEMARGAVGNSLANVALSITGIAGPDGGTDDKPVGTVCFGWIIGGTSASATRHFPGDRTRIREQSTDYALRGLLERLND
jgi:nicotinamide-nucleotide amidase